jgi:hypothetical protein
MYLTYGYELKENDDIVVPARRTGKIRSRFALPGAALVNHLPFRTVSSPPIILNPTTTFSPENPFVGSSIQI